VRPPDLGETMRRTTSRAKGIGIIGLVAFMVGGVLIGTALTASATSPPPSGTMNCKNPACAITIDPDPATTSFAPASAIQVTGADFQNGEATVVECNMAPNEPTIAVAPFGNLNVGCTGPAPMEHKVKGGNFFAGGQVNVSSDTLTLGPPASGNDSAGINGTTDAVNYPCPPTQAQVAAGVSCELLFVDAKGEQAWQDLTFTTAFSTTTTTSSPPTTLVACNGVAKSATATNTKAPHNVGTVTVTPATCLVGGTSVTVTATGLVPNSLGSILECNNDASQPTVIYDGTAIPVSCSKVALITTSASGGLLAANEAFTVLETSPTFTIGPPAAGTDSTGGSAATDAASYPCPPTAAQVTAGVGCVIAVGDLGGDQVAVPISFNTAVPPPANGGAGATTTTVAKAATKAATKTKASSLAFTGTGPGLWWLALVGSLLVLLGAFMLAVVDGPRRFLRFAHNPRVRNPIDTE